jgi:hypothetical protein
MTFLSISMCMFEILARINYGVSDYDFIFDTIRTPFPPMWTMGECLKVARSVFPMMLVTLIFLLDNTIDRQGPMEDSLENLKSVVKKQKETMEEC